MSIACHDHRAPRVPAHSTPGNLVGLVLGHARVSPEQVALVQGATAVTYGELADRVAAYVDGIERATLPARARVLLLAPPDVELYALALAMLATGRILVFVDGRRGVHALLGALREARADVIVAPRALLRWWPVVPALRRARRFHSTGALRGSVKRGNIVSCVDPAAPAIVSFSSGTGGEARAVMRTHAVLVAQHRALAAALRVDAGDVNLPGFPVATLHNLCCGTTTVLPGADLRAMADASPEQVLALIERNGVTSLCGAPAFMSRLVAAIVARGVPATGVRHLAVGGGPVGRALAADLARAFPRATAHVVYGATEAEPIATVTLAELLAADDEEGFLVGVPPRDTRVQLESAEGQRGLTGEVTVRGAQVAGVPEGGWHRTGDVGRLDARGRLWLLGRVGAEVKHRGRVLHPYVAEAAALAVNGVRVAALVAHPRAPEGELCVELAQGADVDVVLPAVRDALVRRGLDGIGVRVRATIPTDGRHASKVSRRVLIQAIAKEGR